MTHDQIKKDCERKAIQNKQIDTIIKAFVHLLPTETAKVNFCSAMECLDSESLIVQKREEQLAEKMHSLEVENCAMHVEVDKVQKQVEELQKELFMHKESTLDGDCPYCDHESFVKKIDEKQKQIDELKAKLSFWESKYTCCNSKPTCANNQLKKFCQDLLGDEWTDKHERLYCTIEGIETDRDMKQIKINELTKQVTSSCNNCGGKIVWTEV